MSRALRLLRYLWTDVGRPIQPAPNHPTPLTWPADRVTAAWLGHSTVLLNFHGLTILTDPVFFSRIGVRPWPFTIGPKRHIACALQPRELPAIDLVLLSHAHMDHLDKASLRRLSRESTVVMPWRTADVLPWPRFRTVHELGWGETLELFPERGGLTITALQMRHWGERIPWDQPRGYNAYILERAGRRICFVGDTARTNAQHLGSRGPLDLIIIPIAAYNPWINAHCTPEEAVEMADESDADFVMPVHHETFMLSHEPLDEPIRRFRAALAAKPTRLATAAVGDTFTLPLPNL